MDLDAEFEMGVTGMLDRFQIVEQYRDPDGTVIWGLGLPVFSGLLNQGQLELDQLKGAAVFVRIIDHPITKQFDVLRCVRLPSEFGEPIPEPGLLFEASEIFRHRLRTKIRQYTMLRGSN